MQPIKVVIIDDEQAAIDVIQALIEQLTKDLKIVGTAYDGLDAIQLIAQSKPDLVFLDINMPLINGIEVAEKLPFKDLNLIFTTGSTAHAIKAIKLAAVDYLLKPIGPVDFISAVEKVRIKLNAKQQSARAPLASTKIQLPLQDKIIFLEESDILHIDGMGSYCYIHTINNEGRILVSKSIGLMEEKLSSNFFRCHNSHIINLNYVNSFIKKDGYFVILKDGSQIEVSRRAKDTLLKKLNEQTR